MGKPSFNATVLDSGITVVTDYLPDAKSASVFWQLLSGANRDPEEREGCAHYFEHVLGGGHKYDPQFDLSQLEKRWGVHIRLATGPEYTFSMTTIMPRRVAEYIDALGNMVCHALLEKQEIEKQKTIIRNEYFETMGDSDKKFSLDAMRSAYGNRGFSRPVIGTLDAITAISKDDLEDYRKNFYLAEDMVLCVSGPVPHEHVVKLAECAFKDVQRGKNKPLPVVPYIPGKQLWFPSEGKQQIVGIATDFTNNPTISKTTYFDWASFLGNDLNECLRDNGIAYAVKTSIDNYKDHTYALISFKTEAEKAAHGLRVLTKFYRDAESIFTKERHEILNEAEELQNAISDPLTENRANTIRANFARSHQIRSFEEISEDIKLKGLAEIQAAHRNFMTRSVRVFTTGPCREVGEFDIKEGASPRPPEPKTP